MTVGVGDLLKVVTDSELYTIVDTSEVWRAVHTMTADEATPVPSWLLDTCLLPNVAPPYDRVLMVYNGTGIAIEAFDTEDDGRILAVMAADAAGASPMSDKDGYSLGTCTGESHQWIWPDIPPRTKWVLRISRWNKRGCISWWYLPVDENGASLGLSSNMMAMQPDMTEAEVRDVFSDGQVAVRMSLFSLSLMHCRNVDADDAAVRESRQVRRCRERRGEPGVEYKVLRITPTGSKGGSSTAESESMTALHLCRGHFKTYTKDAPLFGTIVGTYWWSPQARGNPSAGVVVKDYEIGS